MEIETTILNCTFRNTCFFSRIINANFRTVILIQQFSFTLFALYKSLSELIKQKTALTRMIYRGASPVPKGAGGTCFAWEDVRKS